ncbi:MAG: ABC transporter substrate-binding protein [Mesorhizobium sp.]|uniref:ABC transporter substrate-binding protein n=1 Tax=unclassified Mesorhizobium TaxID=325217 RepID=UPI000F76467F|nr:MULTISPECIES: ABC transporter substrate-binding protein [unclassified Mesorhizobium]AZO33602.1 ABC transporter substrate-binding protein [Mesorhizobium sp. M2A.F.Ca.ET.046.03.2.1]RWB38746.1 MAG: ABC transporter substrate-binding protein [Mesorhizobium sp.]RWE22198.1 MAG: ABC transporter substrate-binding protein [Mesorhizobium sp.]
MRKYFHRTSQPVVAVMAALAMIGLFTAGAIAEPVKLRVSWVSAPSNLISLMMKKSDILLHAGKSYVVEPVYVAGSSPTITALQAGELDIGTLNYVSLPLAVQNAGLTDLKAFSLESLDGGEGCFSAEFRVRKGSGIKTVEDLKGKVVATIGRGSGVHLSQLAMLKKHGLEENRDYTLIESPFPTMKALLKDGKADLIASTSVTSADPELQENSDTLFTTRDAFGGPVALSFWVVSQSFLDKNRAAVVDFMEDFLRVNRWYTDPANRQEALKIFSEATKLPTSAIDAYVFKPGKDFCRPHNLALDPALLQKNVDVVRGLGVVKADFDAMQHFDPTIVNEAAARLQ